MTTTTKRTRTTKTRKAAPALAYPPSTPPPDFVPAKTATTTTEPMRMLDPRLLATDTEEARDEIRRRVEHRRSFGLPLRGPAYRPADYEAAPDATILLLDDLGVDLAAAERKRRAL